MAHSMGGNIVHDVLSFHRPKVHIDLLVTVGTQVGLFEELKLFAASDPGVPSPQVTKVLALRNVALDHWALPLTGEGLGLLYEDVIRHPEPSRHIEARVMPLVAAAHSSTLLTYTAPEPGDPRVSVRRPDRSPRGPVRTFRLGPLNDSGVRLTLERTPTVEQPWQTQLQVAAAASEASRRTVYHLSVRCGPRREDRDLMWELARLVMDAGVHDGELRFTAPDHVVVPLTGVPGAARDRLMRIVEEWWFGARRVGTLTLTTPSGGVLLDYDSADAPDPRALPELLRADED
ncbi:hypothetical protein BJ965_006799 [Streptomyces luteogriseus]|uniref:Uncharacterized protein n=1 Tax=Streptomyces luteogriseus TaxID=68233 RepID=A0A7W7DUE3_9ACTN|nr:hypothetical protein [Streptomyces luteogriseus]MBB4716917.1 hypothetical protein [Streptomyces luteogriseus]